MSIPSKIAVIGLGYIGLPTAAALATRGAQVAGVDVDEQIVESVNRGEAPFVEPELAVAVRGAAAMGNLVASRTVPEADAFILAVPTPFKEGNHADLSYVQAAAEAVAPQLRGGEVVILESTAPPGTTRKVSEWIGDLRPDLIFPHMTDTAPDVHVAHCPERVLPGRIMIEIVTNNRVIGGLTRTCAKRAAEVYGLFSQGDLLLTDAESAEMSKLVENAYRDVNIAFANELSLVCEQLGLDVWEIRKMANQHPRVEVLQPGPGVGGHCIAVDPWFIIDAAPELARLMRTAREVNDSKPLHVADQVISTSRRFREPRIACLGLAFKADVDDLRESPAVEIVHRVAAALPDVGIDAVEPHVDRLPARLAAVDNIRLTPMAEAVDNADIVVLLVDHDRFRSIKKARLAGKVVYDTRGLWA